MVSSTSTVTEAVTDIVKWTEPLQQPTGKSWRHELSSKLIKPPTNTGSSPTVGPLMFTTDCGAEISFRISLPTERFALIEDLQEASKDLPWVFVPSHNRSQQASLDYEGTMEHKRIVIVVCRDSDEFEKYRKAVGHKLPIVALPVEFEFIYPGYLLQRSDSREPHGSLCSGTMSMNVNAENHKIGHARLFIQLLARSFFKLTEIWMLDDNVVSCFDRLKPKGEEGLDDLRCRFDTVMQAVERILVRPELDTETTIVLPHGTAVRVRD